MRLFTILTGILLVLASVWCFAHPGASFLTLAFILGVAMLIHGMACVLGYLSHKNKQESHDWLLAEGAITFILACIVLSNQLVTDAVIPLFFGMWIMFSGIMRVVASIAQRRIAGNGWAWTLSLGAVGVMAGIYSFFNPILGSLALGMLLGIFFFIQGLNMLTTGIMMPKKKNDRKTGERERSGKNGKN